MLTGTMSLLPPPVAPGPPGPPPAAPPPLAFDDDAPLAVLADIFRRREADAARADAIARAAGGEEIEDMDAWADAAATLHLAPVVAPVEIAAAIPAAEPPHDAGPDQSGLG